MSYIAGIDPGLSGAVAVLDPGGQIVVTSLLRTEPHGKRELIHVRNLNQLLVGQQPIHSVIENVATRPGQGIASSGQFMCAVGAIYATATLSGSVSWVTPQVWKKHFGLLKTTKEESRLRALSIWPDKSECFTPKRGHLKKKQAQDAAEAALIARWYWETGGKRVRDLLRGAEKKVGLVNV